MFRLVDERLVKHLCMTLAAFTIPPVVEKAKGKNSHTPLFKCFSHLISAFLPRAYKKQHSKLIAYLMGLRK